MSSSLKMKFNAEKFLKKRSQDRKKERRNLIGKSVKNLN